MSTVSDRSAAPSDAALLDDPEQTARFTSWSVDDSGRRIGVSALRLSGIYGPGRNALANLRAGTARRIIKSGQVFNRIHVEDIARAVAASDPQKAVDLMSLHFDESVRALLTAGMS